MQDTKRDFFISYVKADEWMAEWIAWTLEEAGKTCILQGWDFIPGKSFVSEIHKALQVCERLVLVLSKTYVTSEWTEAEWTSFFPNDPIDKMMRILPIRIDSEFRPVGLLTPLIYIDITGLDKASAKQLILSAVKGVRRKPSSEPPFEKPQSAGSSAVKVFEKEPQWLGPLASAGSELAKVSWKLFTIVLKASLLVVIVALTAILAALDHFFGGGGGWSFLGAAPGSTILMFKGKEESFDRLKNAYVSGELKDIQGFEIDYIRDVSEGIELFRPDFNTAVSKVATVPVSINVAPNVDVKQTPVKSWLDKIGESISREMKRATEELKNQLEKTKDKGRMH